MCLRSSVTPAGPGRIIPMMAIDCCTRFLGPGWWDEGGGIGKVQVQLQKCKQKCKSMTQTQNLQVGMTPHTLPTDSADWYASRAGGLRLWGGTT